MTLLPLNTSIAPSILIVEDESLIAEELQDRLMKLGYRVLGHVASADDALAAARETKPDLVLMDIRLKGERDGISAAAEIHAEHGVPVVYLTAHSDGDTVRRARETAPFGYVLKPFHERDLLVALEMALQRHGVERRLRESEARYAATLASIGDGVIATDSRGQVTFMNAVAEGLTGWPLAEARGREVDGVLTLIGEEDCLPRANPVRRALDSRDVVHCRERLFLLDRRGGRTPFEDCAAPIQDPAGRLMGAVVAFRDASERRRGESALELSRERLRRVERMEVLGRLASGVAHDFNNLLTVIQESAELLDAESTDGAERRELLDNILDACTSAARLTERLLASGRRARPAPVVVDLNRLVEETRGLLVRLLPESIRLRVDLERQPCPLAVDPGQLESLLLNLATNARDAMPGGGELRFTTALVEVDAQAPALDIEGEVPPGRYVRLVVSDSGTGMTPEVRARLFEPFFTTKAPGEGTGLGLASVKGVVREAHGFLEVRSAPCLGTSFQLHFPALAPERLNAAASVPPSAAVRGHERVLLVEDDVAVRAVTRHALESRGYRVVVAAEAEEALERVRAGVAFEILICDMGLPGSDGLCLARALRTHLPGMALLFLSGHPRSLERARAELSDCGVLEKPFRGSELARCVREQLDARRPARS